MHHVVDGKLKGWIWLIKRHGESMHRQYNDTRFNS